GLRNLLFFMAEWGNLYIIGAVVATLFLGGWQIPLALTEHPVARTVLQFALFFAKAYFWVFVAVWLRWTLPRIRVDQMMIMCWKYLVPIAFVNFMGTAVWMVLFPAGVPAVRVLLSLSAAGLLVAFARRVVFHVRRALLTREELSFNPLSTARVSDRLHRDRGREGQSRGRARHDPLRHRHGEVHVLRPLQRAVPDGLDPPHARVRRGGLLAREPGAEVREGSGHRLQAEEGWR